MKITINYLQLLMFMFCLNNFCNAQNPARPDPPPNWQLMDIKEDSIFGTSVTRAYRELLKGKKSHPVLVAVIDKGIDTNQEDLKGHIWVNIKEISGNGIDDDHNGYIDDMHGWNFPGGKDGRELANAGWETLREYHRLKKQYATVSDTSGLTEFQRKEYRDWLLKKQTHVNDSAKLVNNINWATNLIRRTTLYDSTIRTKIKKDSLIYADVDKIIFTDSSLLLARDSIVTYYNRYHIPKEEPVEKWIQDGYDFVKGGKEQLANLQIDPNLERKEIVGDNPDDISDLNYGNNNIAAGNPDHGTEVAGIIAAIRGNGIGMEGITDHVLIMPIRAIGQTGDERDKDVALAIRYAVDNGARIINMSFGKYLSPDKYMVDDAIKYAREKNVLMIKAAGNDSYDMDSTIFYPSAFLDKESVHADNLITVGASNAWYDSTLCAWFSNYGKKEVDVFAPGVAMFMSAPGNKYVTSFGTSFASPTVAGIAALIWEYYPSLNYKQIKYCIEKSAKPIDLLVLKPGTQTKIPFNRLSKTGGIVNAYEALAIAEKISRQ